MNIILDDLYKSGMLCPNDIEFESYDEMECTIAQIAEHLFQTYSSTDIREYLEGMTIHYLGDDPAEDDKFYNFNMSEFLNKII